MMSLAKFGLSGFKLTRLFLRSANSIIIFLMIVFAGFSWVEYKKINHLKQTIIDLKTTQDLLNETIKNERIAAQDVARRQFAQQKKRITRKKRIAKIAKKTNSKANDKIVPFLADGLNELKQKGTVNE